LGIKKGVTPTGAVSFGSGPHYGREHQKTPAGLTHSIYNIDNNTHFVKKNLKLF
jgi:hypothetical protein